MIEDSFSDWLRILWSFISGSFLALIGYFLPVKNIVHLLILFFVFDMLFGYWAAKVRGERFSAKIIWTTTMPRMVISLILIICAFMWDQVYDQNMIPTYRYMGWFISGVLLANIIKNSYRITKWDIFLGLGDVFKQKMKLRNENSH